MTKLWLQGEFRIDQLLSGGLITNYYCTSSCGHCLYGCSPRWKKDYIDTPNLRSNFEKIKSLGCSALHIGGGEPFLNLDGLETVLESAQSSGVHIEYVETNSSWYRDRESACRTLTSLKKKGLSSLLISMSPFHNEHIPFYKVKGVIDACRKVDIVVFPWISDFYSEIDAFDDKRTHGLSEYEEKYGHEYLRKLPGRYWIHFGGRALKTFSPVFGVSPYQEILVSNDGGCAELLDTSHFHFDLFGNYIPGLCSGLAIQGDDLGEVISRERYPILDLLFHKGVNGLLEYVSKEYDFKPSEGYLSKCQLCFDLRRFLVVDIAATYRELEPKEFYFNV